MVGFNLTSYLQYNNINRRIVLRLFSVLLLVVEPVENLLAEFYNLQNNRAYRGPPYLAIAVDVASILSLLGSSKCVIALNSPNSVNMSHATNAAVWQ